jgi:4'-phosphopantetheinyl transferase
VNTLQTKHNFYQIFIPDVSSGLQAELKSYLSAEELTKAAKFLRSQDQTRFIIARGMLKKLLSEQLHLTPQKIKFIHGKYGKPGLKPTQNPQNLHFNLSHSHELIVYTFAFNQNIGIDTEYIKPISSMSGLVKRFFSKNENTQFFNLPQAKHLEAFYKCWTSKESYLKALGLGITNHLSHFSVDVNPDTPPKLLQTDSPKILKPLHLEKIDSPKNYYSVLAYRPINRL